MFSKLMKFESVLFNKAMIIAATTALSLSLAGCSSSDEDPVDCASDQCFLLGECYDGEDDDTCGKNGLECNECDSDEKCVDQKCQKCADYCDGCCDSRDRCKSGSSDSYCGEDGDSCDECKDGEEECDDKKCIKVDCDSTSCASGCCDGNKCVTSHSTSFCGDDGDSCEDCDSDDKCTKKDGEYACRSSSSTEGTYKVTVVSASVESKDADGDFWDNAEGVCDTLPLSYCSPDVYIESGSTVAGISVSSNADDDTTSPSWNEVVGNFDAEDLEGASINIILKDEDVQLTIDDDVGTCTHMITASEMDKGQVVLTDSDNECTGQIRSLVVTFVKED